MVLRKPAGLHSSLRDNYKPVISEQCMQHKYGIYRRFQSNLETSFKIAGKQVSEKRELSG